MHKTLYIDIDEEITSIIDRLKKSQAKEIIIVVPKGAMLLQSVVNLKLLKKEVDRQKKQLMIITQDKIGKKLIEKAGILVQGKPSEDLEYEEETEDKAYGPIYGKEAAEIKTALKKEESSEDQKIGSSSFFEAGSKTANFPQKEKDSETVPAVDEIKGKKEKDSPTKKKNERSQISMSDIVIKSLMPKTKKDKKISAPKAAKTTKEDVASFNKSFEYPAELSKEKRHYPHTIDRNSMKKAEKFFKGSRRMKKEFEIAKVSGHTKKFFAIFSAIFVVLAGAAAGYFLLPKANLALELINQGKSVSLTITAEENSKTNPSQKIVEAFSESIEKEITKEFNSSGNQSGGLKANGKAVIYNEFSAEDQPLVATTRLETPDGKIFRITKNIVVPGTTKVGDEARPGAIEVDVVADKPGEEYNIGPADFKIPGFSNNKSKYEKFYARSSNPMTGGSASESKEISAEDIDEAKVKMPSIARKAAIEELEKNLPAGRKIFDEAVETEVASLVSSDAAGADKEKFSITAKVKAKTLSFSESDVKKIIAGELEKSGESSDSIFFNNRATYLLIESDPAKNILKFDVKADMKTLSDIDLENFKKGILGKTVEEAQNYAKSFPAIQKVDITLWPFFTKRIPMNEKRVNIKMK